MARNSPAGRAADSELEQCAARGSLRRTGTVPPSSDTPALGVGEAAAGLDVSPSTVRRWVDSGRLGSIRTEGGHRRILAADIRNEASRRRPSVKLNLASPPSGPAPQLAALLQGHGEAVLNAAATDIYARRGVGWFGAAGSLEARQQWVAQLAGACRTGDYANAISGSRSFFRLADIAGATMLERHLLSERFRLRLVQLLRNSDAARSDIYKIARLLQAIEHAVLEAA
jgi:excisionase family DNA binding protein